MLYSRKELKDITLPDSQIPLKRYLQKVVFITIEQPKLIRNIRV